MGFFDKIKGAVNAVTGGGAKVTIEYAQQPYAGGDFVSVKVSATSTGAEVKSQGIFIDLQAIESVDIPQGESTLGNDQAVHAQKTLFEQAIQIAPAFVLAAGQTMLFEGRVQLPGNAQPTYDGKFAKNHWGIRGRVEATGNDPDSGFKPIRIGAR